MIAFGRRLAQRSEIFRRSVRVLGLRYTCRLYASARLRPGSHDYDDSIDDKWTVDTSGAWDYEEGELEVAFEEAEGYEGARVDVVRHAFGLLPIKPEETEFWDLGSGKGRVVILAAESGFTRTVGVELDERLHTVASTNTASVRKRLPDADIQLIRASATDIELPDVPLVVFMFNPFRGSLFQEVFELIEKRAVRSQCPLWIVYINPQERELLDHSPHFELVAEEIVNPRWWSMNLYRST